MTRFRRLHLCLILLPMTGCASFSTVMLNRSEDNSYWQKEKFLRGVPVTLKVPTHVRIDVLEKHFLFLNPGVPVSRSKPKVPIRHVNYTPIETEKIFLVDLKRPGAGTIDAEIDFDPDNQYFKEIKTKVEDETIKAIGDLIATIAPGGLFGAPTSEQGANFKGRVKEVSSVVASQVFEIDAPDFEIQIMCFLDRHLNCCHDCGLVPPGTLAPAVLPSRSEFKSINRYNIVPTQAVQGPDCQSGGRSRAPEPIHGRETEAHIHESSVTRALESPMNEETNAVSPRELQWMTVKRRSQ